MALSCAWIIWEAVQRIFFHPVEVHHSLWPVLVLVTSIGVDFWRSRQLRAVAARTGSPALATDAFHFASDIWATSAVLVGLGASWAGERFRIAALHYADPLAALVVSLMILRMTVRLGHEAVAALVDEIPAETRRRLVREVERVDGVLAVERARVRRAGAGYFADLTLALPRRFTFEHTDELVEAATCRSSTRAARRRRRHPHGSARDQSGKHLRPRARRGCAQQRFGARAQHPDASWASAGGAARGDRGEPDAPGGARLCHRRSKRRFCATFRRSTRC